MQHSRRAAKRVRKMQEDGITKKLEKKMTVPKSHVVMPCNLQKLSDQLDSITTFVWSLKSTKILNWKDANHLYLELKRLRNKL